MRPALTESGTEQTRRQTCFCGHEFQQTAIETDEVTDLGVVIGKRTVFAPIRCPKCTRAKIRESAHTADPRVGARS